MKGCSVKHCGLSVKTSVLYEGDGGVWEYLLENPRYPDSLGLWRGYSLSLKMEVPVLTLLLFA